MTKHLTPSDRASLIARAKRAAVPVANLVAARLKHGHITGGMTRAELEALVIVLAEAADHAKLRDVCAAEDDGRPDGQADSQADDGLRQRRAHNEARRLREAGQPVPLPVRVLDNAYTGARKAARAAERGAAVPPDPDAERNRETLAGELRERQRASKAVA